MSGLSGQLWDHVLRPVGVENKGLPDSKQNMKLMVDPAQAQVKSLSLAKPKTAQQPHHQDQNPMCVETQFALKLLMGNGQNLDVGHGQ